jgi:flagellar biosynthetic protein FlhB
MLLTGMMILYMVSARLFEQLRLTMSAVFLNLSIQIDSTEALTYWFRAGIYQVFIITMPFLFIMFAVAFGASALQVGFLFTTEPMKPKWKKVNVFDPSNYKRYFDSQVFIRLGLGIGKMAVVSIISYILIRRAVPETLQLTYATTGQIFLFVSRHAFLIGIAISLMLLFLGIIDYAYQVWKFKKDMRMTKQEIKDERKQSEGDVQVKSKMRSMMQAMARNRMKENVPQADVIVANPIHFAIALKYDGETMAAPICLAKGARKTAIMIKEIAHENGIPIVENPPLAQALYKTVEIGMPVPGNLYHGVAEVLAYVYRLNNQAQLARR